jgi:hypothetical protein
MIDIQPTGTREWVTLYPCTDRAVIWLKDNVTPDASHWRFGNSVNVGRDQFRAILKMLKCDGLQLPSLIASTLDVRSEFHGNLIDFYPVSEKGREWLLAHLPDDPWPAAYGNRHRIPHGQAGLLFQALAKAGLTVS